MPKPRTSLRATGRTWTHTRQTHAPQWRRPVGRLTEIFDQVLPVKGHEILNKKLIVFTISFKNNELSGISRVKSILSPPASRRFRSILELLFQHAMAHLRQGPTSFVIAHRLSTIRSADLIIYTEAGNVMEQGPHDALIAARGRYFVLYKSQFAGDDVAG